MEGISNEVCSLAGHWGLGKLIALYDDNRISIDGHTEISFTEDVAARFEALGWHVQHVKDGNTDLKSLREAIETAKSVTDKPSFIKARARRSAGAVGLFGGWEGGGLFSLPARFEESPACCPAGGRQAGRHALRTSAAFNCAQRARLPRSGTQSASWHHACFGRHLGVRAGGAYVQSSRTAGVHAAPRELAPGAERVLHLPAPSGQPQRRQLALLGGARPRRRRVERALAHTRTQPLPNPVARRCPR